MFKTMKLRNRILLGYLVPFLLLLALMSLVYASLQSALNRVDQLNKTADLVPNILSLGDSLVRIQRAAYAYVLMNGKTDVAGGYPKKLFEASELRFQTLIKESAKRDLNTTQQESLRQLEEVGHNIIRVNRHYMTLIDEGKEGETITEFRRGESVRLASQIDPLTDRIVQIEMENREKRRASVAEAMTLVRNSVLIGTISSLVLMIILGLWVATVLSRHIYNNVSKLSAATGEIAATIIEQERTSSQQASMVNETTTTIQELSASATQTSGQASLVTGATQRSLKTTEEGVVMVKQSMDGMNNLGVKIGMIADQILKLGEQTAQLGNLANMVKDLSGEINMLALNAAVEAARAGEHGKGFAVVAAEIRKLANESKQSAEQSNTVISDIQKATNATVLRIEEGTKVVEEVTSYARNVGELFNSLSEAANTVYENVQQVMLNTKQQSAAIGQIVEAMNSLNAGAKETASGIVQTKAGIEQLNLAAVNLTEIV